MAAGLFITGTDTEVGKTVVACALARVLSDRGLNLKVRKPAESGCAELDGRLLGPDSLSLKKAARADEPLDIICPYRFKEPIAPEAAAHMHGVDLSLDNLKAACKVVEGDFLLVEGAGGWLSPLAQDNTNADLAKALGLDVVLVVANRLGCINHTLLTLASIDSYGLGVKAIYLNSIGENLDADYSKDLTRWVDLEVVKLPFIKGEKPWDKLLDIVDKCL